MYFRPEIAYDEDGEAYIPMSPGNIFYGLFITVIAVVGTAVVLLAAFYNSIMWVVKCAKRQREAEEKKTYPSYQYDRRLSIRDPELVDKERGWVRYTTAKKEAPNPNRSHLFDYGNGEKGFWEYNV